MIFMTVDPVTFVNLCQTFYSSAAERLWVFSISII